MADLDNIVDADVDLGIDLSDLNEEGMESNMTCEANFTDVNGTFWCNDTYDPFEHSAFDFNEFHSGQDEFQL